MGKNRKESRAVLGERAFKLFQKKEKLTFKERNVLNIALKKAKKR